MTLQEAVASIKNHDGQSEKAFQIIYEETRRTALAVIKRYCDISADYEDLLQETYIRVYRSIDTLKDDTKVGAWIRTIAGNTAIRHNMKKWPTMFSDMADEEGMFRISRMNQVHLIRKRLQTGKQCPQQ
ncbi:MAG: sigma factor [Enterocloster sp.]